MTTSAIIFANGSGARWPLEQPKQLVDIDGEKVLHRTIRQLNHRGIDDITLVTSDSRLLHRLCAWFQTGETRWLAETVEKTAGLWEPDQIHLLGDVYFSHDAMDTMLEDDHGDVFFGRSKVNEATQHPMEIFGWRIGHDPEWTHSLWKRGVEHAVEFEKRDPKGKQMQGSAWQPYRLLAGENINKHRVYNVGWVEIDDETADFDWPHMLAKWKEAYR